MGKSNGKELEEAIFANVAIGEMVVDAYQGHINKALIETIIAKWSLPAAGAIILNLRDDGTYAVLDGQHRVKAAAEVGVTELPAYVFIGKRPEEEAKLFVQLNTKHAVRSIDKFRANLFAGLMTEKNIVHALRELGLDVATSGPSQDGRRLSCVGALTKIYSGDGVAFFKLVVGTLHAAFDEFPHRERGYLACAVSGLAAFLRRYPSAPIPLVIETLKQAGPNGMLDCANASRRKGEDNASAWGKALLSLYNERFRSANAKGRLSDSWKKVALTEAGRQTARESLRKTMDRIGHGKVARMGGAANARRHVKAEGLQS